MASVAVQIDNPLAGDGALQPGDRLLVNKGELARKVLKCSLPTVNELVAKYSDFPIEKEGSNGVEWQFDVDKVVAFLTEKREIERRESESRNELFGQLTLPSLFTRQAGLPASQRLADVKARQIEHKLALETGFLLHASETRNVLQIALARLGRFLDGLPSEMERRFNLPTEVATAMRARLDERRAEFVGELKIFLLQDG